MNLMWRVMPNPDSDKLYDVVPGLSGHPIYPVDGYTAIASSLTIYQALLIAAAPDLLDIVARLADWTEGVPGDKSDPHDNILKIAHDAGKLWAEMQREAKGGGE